MQDRTHAPRLGPATGMPAYVVALPLNKRLAMEASHLNEDEVSLCYNLLDLHV